MNGGPAVGDLIVGGFSETPRASCMPIPQTECLLNENAAGSPACST